ncbi:MAG: ABC transporter permease [Phycisphaeraceae bacterium]
MSAKYRIIKTLDAAGLSVFEPVVRLCTGEEPRVQLRKIMLFIVCPVLAFMLFLGIWAMAASSIQTKYGTVPTPGEVWTAGGGLMDAHHKQRAEETVFYKEQKEKAVTFRAQAAAFAERAQAAASADQKERMLKQQELYEKQADRALTARFAAGPTYIDQIFTSLKTVFAGFLIASLVAIPIGILCGINKVFMAAINPLVQIFKPVSPLAWLPIVMIIVGALYTTDPTHAWFEKSFISSAVTVALCSLWPTLINTALGVASIDKDHLNVARVLKLSTWTKIRKIVVPSALPYIFAGLRISLGVGWMVLIAAEMLAQNPGLGKFVWDMFQNGSSQTLALIMVAVFTIGVIGFLLDRIMIVLQKAVSFDEPVSA